MSSELIMITGPPGSGKSTVSALLAEEFDKSVELEIDWFWQIIKKGKMEPWRKEADLQNKIVMQAAVQAAAGYIEGNYTVIADGIIGPWFLKVWVQKFRTVAAEVHYFILRPKMEVALTRARNRNKTSTGEYGIYHMWQAFQNLGKYERFTIDNSDEKPEETLQYIKDCLDLKRNELIRSRLA